MSKQPKLKPCPFCGGDAITKIFAMGSWIICFICGAETAMYPSEKKAIEAWNRRAKNA